MNKQKIVTFGEIMMRLTPPDYLRFNQTNLFRASYGGSEANVAVSLANFGLDSEFITRLPDGYNTMLTGNGASLSQGQRQLISIARAAVADPPAMILDEATSSIDTRTEKIVQDGMDKLMKGKTCFVIAHRLSTIVNADMIIAVDSGRIVDIGTHKQLLEEGGFYAKLYNSQYILTA